MQNHAQATSRVSYTVYWLLALVFTGWTLLWAILFGWGVLVYLGAPFYPGKENVELSKLLIFLMFAILGALPMIYAFQVLAKSSLTKHTQKNALRVVIPVILAALLILTLVLS